MVERLREAIEKAREKRTSLTPRPNVAAANEGASVGAAANDVSARWRALPTLPVDEAALLRHRIVTRTKADPSHVTFDVLRTRLLKACRDNNWRRIGILSPAKGSGKTFITANLAFSAARQKDVRVLLLDLDLRAPHLAKTLGAKGDWSIGALLRGDASFQDAVAQIDDNLAVALNVVKERHPAELMQSVRAAKALQALEQQFEPTVVLIDLPPLLVVDDAIGFLPSIDAALLIVESGRSTPEEIEECERLISANCAFLGVLLNKHRSDSNEQYAYESA